MSRMSNDDYRDIVEQELEESLGDDYDYWVDLDEVLSDERIDEAIEEEIDPRDYAALCIRDYAID